MDDTTSHVGGRWLEVPAAPPGPQGVWTPGPTSGRVSAGRVGGCAGPDMAPDKGLLRWLWWLHRAGGAWQGTAPAPAPGKSSAGSPVVAAWRASRVTGLVWSLTGFQRRRPGSQRLLSTGRGGGAPSLPSLCKQAGLQPL